MVDLEMAIEEAEETIRVTLVEPAGHLDQPSRTGYLNFPAKRYSTMKLSETS